MQLESFYIIDSYELAALVQANSPRIHAYICAIGNIFSHRACYFEELLEFGHRNQDHSGVKELLPLVHNLSLNRPIESIDFYDVMFASPWASHIDVEKQHLEISNSLAKWIKTSNEDQIDFLQILLLNLMIFFSTDGVNLNEHQRSKIEALQLKYTLMYHRYLQWAHPKDCRAKFVGGLMLLQQAKQLTDLCSQRLRL